VTSLGRSWLVVLALACVLFARSAGADTRLPRQLEGTDIVDRTGASIPRDIHLRDSAGREFTTGELLDGGKPVVLQLAYFECPMLCSLVINGLLQGMKTLPQTAGDEYRVLVVSFDPKDTVDSASKKRQAYVGAYGRPLGPAERGFEFAVGEPSEVQRLAEAVGFRYRWDEQTEQYAHAAGAFVLAPTAQLSRTLFGITFQPRDLNLALREAAQGKTGTPVVDRILLYCFHYDPNVGSYVIASTRLMKGAGAVTVLGLSYWLMRLWRRDRRRGAVILEQRL
jgi:protein SCO1/2